MGGGSLLAFNADTFAGDVGDPRRGDWITALGLTGGRTDKDEGGTHDAPGEMHFERDLSLNFVVDGLSCYKVL